MFNYFKKFVTHSWLDARIQSINDFNKANFEYNREQINKLEQQVSMLARELGYDIESKPFELVKISKINKK
jgi:hypothetical protein